MKKRARRPQTKHRGQRKRAPSPPAAPAAALRAEITALRDQQAATSEILRIISRSPSDVQSVFDTIVHSAKRLLGALTAVVTRLTGDELHLAAFTTTDQSADAELRGFYPQRVSGASAHAHAVRTLAPVNIGDTETDSQISAAGRKVARVRGYRGMLVVPIVRDGTAVGTLSLSRAQPGLFTPAEVGLLQTFADQAGIAIENVRLFTEVEAHNNALTATLDQQTATAEILRVISSSPTDVQPVFDAIAASAVRLCDAVFCVAYRFDGALIHPVAHHNMTPDALEALKEMWPAPPSRDTVTARSILEHSIVHVTDVIQEGVSTASIAFGGTLGGYRTMLAVPMFRDGLPIGTISVARREKQPFSDTQVELLKTFADQAVIAVENVRLFKELEVRNRDLTEALEQQTATSEILRVISRSQTDVQPVFDTIVRSAVKLCDGLFSALYQFDGELIHRVAQHNNTPEALEAAHRVFPARPTRTLYTGRAILERAVVHIPDVEVDPEFQYQALSRAIGLRSGLWVPMLREGTPIGVISVARAEPGPFSDNEIELLKTFADQAVIAIENARLFKELEARNRDLSDALEQQTATAEILGVISSSPTDVQPVFDAIVRSATRLCGGRFGTVNRFDGTLMHLAAHYNIPPDAVDELHRLYPRPLDEGSLSARAVRDGRAHQNPDVQADPTAPIVSQRMSRVLDFRSQIVVPMLRGTTPIGTLSIARVEPGLFPGKQVELLKAFADQAVIAIENVRLFTELQEKNLALTEAHAQVTEALEQQTATAEILRVISRSQTDVQPVFDTIVRSAVRLCDGLFSALLQFDGELIHQVAQHNYTPEALEEAHRIFPARPTRALGSGRAILERAMVHIPDVEVDPEYQHQTLPRAVGWRSGLWVPMLREGAPIGVIFVARAEAGPFSNSEMDLLKTFADQAVIAVENVRLFKELEARNHDLTEALEQQTATAEILRVISRSQTDVQPVFDTIVRSAVRLCDGLFSALCQFDGELLHHVAYHNYTPEALEEVRRIFPVRPSRALGAARAILDRAVVHIPDVEVDPEYQHQVLSRAIGFRSGLFVPMLREGAPIGVIVVTRAEPGLFSDNEIELLKTFADQAVIAVENVRLFKELEARTGELTQSVEKLTALGEVSRAVSSTLDVETVLDTIVSRASQLAGADGCSIFEYDEGAQQFELRATHNVGTAFVEALRAVPLRKGEGLMGRAAEMREPVQIPDITQPGAYESSVRDTLIRFGYRALLSVPLLREDQIIGSLSFNRKAPGEFPPEVVDVLKTFATQSALAIQNARLFREIADKSAQLEAASRHKSEFLANMSHELRTPLNAIIGFSEILAEKMFGDINEKQTEYLQDILESGRHLLSLINDILDLSKIEAGRMELERSEFDLPNAIENALILVRERASRRGIKLGSAIDERLGVLSGDERKVKQVLLNLLSNALKFTPEGGRIDVGARLHDGVAEVSVADTGVGIAPADQDAVFEEFRQVGTADKKAEGTGLGLALSRKFIELHGGKIWVKSQVGVGSTFTFTLPVRRGE